MVLGLINMVLTTMRQDFNIMQTADDAAAAAKRKDKSVRARARLARKGRLSSPAFALELHSALTRWLLDEQQKEDLRSGRPAGNTAGPHGEFDLFSTPRPSSAAKGLLRQRQRGRTSRSSSPLDKAMMAAAAPPRGGSPTQLTQQARWEGRHDPIKMQREKRPVRSGERKGIGIEGEAVILLPLQSWLVQQERQDKGSAEEKLQRRCALSACERGLHQRGLLCQRRPRATVHEQVRRLQLLGPLAQVWSHNSGARRQVH